MMVFAAAKIFEFDSGKMIEQVKEVLESIDNTLQTSLDILTQNPQSMSEMWSLVNSCGNVCKNIGLSLLALFFLVGFVFKVTELDWRNISIDFFVRELVKLILAKALVEMSIDLCIMIFNFGAYFMNSLVLGGVSGVTFGSLDLTNMKTTFEGMGFFEQMWFKIELLTPSLVMRVCNVVIQVVCYGRILQICLMTIISPIPLSTVAGERHKHTALHFCKEYVGVVCQGAIILILIALYKGAVSWLMSGVGEISSITSIWKLVTVTLVLLFGVLGSSKLGKMFLGN